jgi:hypothetical protein
MFSTPSARQLRDAIIEIRKALFPMWSARRLYHSSIGVQLLRYLVSCSVVLYSAVQWNRVEQIVDSCGTVARR